MAAHNVLDKNDFQNKLSKAGTNFVLVVFHATWCDPYKIIARKLEQLEFDFRGLIVLKVDVDKCPDIAMKYDVIALPTFFMIRKGKLLGHFIGCDDYILVTFIEKHLGITY